MIADVPVGIFLSAGMDSGALLGLMRDHSQTDIQTVTIGFKEFEGTAMDEVPLARSVAEHYSVSHHSRYISREEFNADISKIIHAMDQPTIDGINTYFASKAAAEAGLKVVISGVGGDELFGGYRHFRKIPKQRKTLSTLAAFGPLLNIMAAGAKAGYQLMPGIYSPKLPYLFHARGRWLETYIANRGMFAPNELSQFLPDDWAISELPRNLEALENDVEQASSDQNRLSLLECSMYMRNQLLRDTDWAGMAHSIEIRTPLVDFELLKNVANYTQAPISEPAKRVLARSPKTPLPDSIVNRKKTGFATPIGDWITRDTSFTSWRKFAYLSHPSCQWGRKWSVEVLARQAPEIFEQLVAGRSDVIKIP